MEDVNLRGARRIAVIGCIGAGKSTLARVLGDRLALPVFHLDRFWWQGGGYRIVGTKTVQAHAMQPPAFRRLQEDLAAGHTWIIDGPLAHLDVRLSRADTVVFLDLPRRTCMWRIVKRTGQQRPDYPPDVGESWRWMGILLRWVWNYPRKKRPQIVSQIEEYAAQATVVQCRSTSDVRHLLQNIGV